jgi:hypothetical protein
MIGETQVVVGGEVDHLFAVHAAHGLAGAFKFAQPEVASRALELVQLFG